MSRRGKSNGKCIILQLLIAMPALTVLMAFAGAKIILSGTMKQEQMSILIFVMLGLISLVLSMYCAIRMPQKKALWGMATSLCYAMMLMLGNVLFFGVAYHKVIATTGVIIVCGIVGSLLGAIKRRKYA